MARRGKRPQKDRTDGGLTVPGMVVLSLLRERPMHGYELMRTYEVQEVGEWAEVSRPHVYYELKRLAERGLIVKEDGPAPPAGRARTVYRVTPEGVAALAEALSDEGWARAKRPAPFATWMGLSIHAPADARRSIVAARVAFLEEEIVRKDEALRFIDGYDSERARFGRRIVELYVLQARLEIEFISSL